MQRSLSCLGPSRLSFCCCCPPLAPRTQLAHGAHLHHPWGMRVLLINTLSWLSCPEVYSGTGVESQDTQEDRHRQADRGRPGERARGVLPGRGRHPHHRTSRDTGTSTLHSHPSNLRQPALVTSFRGGLGEGLQGLPPSGSQRPTVWWSGAQRTGSSPIPGGRGIWAAFGREEGRFKSD